MTALKAPRVLFLVALTATLAAFAACGDDFGTPTPAGVGSEPTVPSAATPTSPSANFPTSTASAFDGIETHPLTEIPDDLQGPFSPAGVPTTAPGMTFEYERRTDSMPVDGPRPYLGITWNVPLPVAEEDQKALIALLEQIPDTPENRMSLHLGGYELWRSLSGFDLPGPDDPADAFISEFLETLDPARMIAGEEFAPVPRLGPHLSGFGDYMLNVQTFDAIGFDQRNVDQSAVAGSPPDITEVIAGRYDRELALQLLAECDCPQPETASYGGYEYWAWGDDLRGDLSLRHAAPVFDQLGRGGYVLMTEDGLYRTLTVELMEQLIDTLNGSAPNLSASADHRFIADVMAANNVTGISFNDGSFYDEDSAIPEGEGLISSSRNTESLGHEVTRQSNRANALLAPLLSPYETLAFGIGWDGEEQYSVAVIVHDSRAAALDNASRLAERVYSTNSNDGLPWALKLPSLEISVSGNYLVAKFTSESSPGIVQSASGQLLFAHE